MDTHSPSRGFTLMELIATVTIIGVMAAYGFPQLMKVTEQSRVDLACANLESIWTAQRLYKAKTGDFTDKIPDLSDFLDESFLNTIEGTDSAFAYSMSTPTVTAFEIYAERQNSKSWAGTIMLNSTGTFSGNVFSGDMIIMPAPIR
ncbi:MAG: prepilin-type N-terminal cleavage/methylation domain-containing protein [Elusimicrobiaceae bacterium]|nr:prepilin-type N-terminal cleavage/methylation domain-containing protein [Elusimicrobiaceae bacterium]